MTHDLRVKIAISVRETCQMYGPVPFINYEIVLVRRLLA